jgi:hypothetical protein
MTADGKIALGKYDFMATPFPRSTEGSGASAHFFEYGCISSVRVINTLKQADEPYGADFSPPSTSRAWSRPVPDAIRLYRSVINDQLNTAKGIALAFLRAERARGFKDYFHCQEDLLAYTHTGADGSKTQMFRPTIAGQTAMSIFLNLCTLVERSFEPPTNIEYQAELATRFMKITFKLERFFKENMKKMRNDGYLLGDSGLMPFRITGPSLFFYDQRTRAEREEHEPINCAVWCKDKLREIGITDLSPIDKPRVVAGGFTCELM